MPIPYEPQLDLIIRLLESLPQRICDEMDKRDQADLIASNIIEMDRLEFERNKITKEMEDGTYTILVKKY